MRTGYLLFSAVQFLFTILILLLGGFFVGLHYAPHLCFALSQALIDSRDNFLPIGFSILGCGALLLIGFYAMNRGAYFRFVIQNKNAAIEAELFRNYLKTYWGDLFPANELSTDVILHANKKVEIAVEIPALKTEDHEALLEKVEKDLSHILAKYLGYREEFLLTFIVK